MNMQPQIAARPVMSEKRVGIVGALICILGPTSLTLYTPAMPAVVEAFATTEAAAKMSLALYFAGFAIAQLVCGPLSDGLGRKPVTLAFIALYTFASVIAVFAPTIEVLIGARILQGFGAAVGIAISRAIVRDLFEHEQSVRIMNLITIIVTIGPAVAPALGGAILLVSGWHGIFVFMAVAGFCVLGLSTIAIKETVTRDISRIKPKALALSYGSLLFNPLFLSASLVNAGGGGMIFAHATVMPFIMMSRLGLSPMEFGLAMLIPSAAFLFSSVMLRVLMKRFPVPRLVTAGIVLLGISALSTAILLHAFEPTFTTVIVPAAICNMGYALLVAPMATAAMAPFGKNAGAAASLLGFTQMTMGLLGSMAMALVGDPVLGMANISPLLGLIAIVAWATWKRLSARAAVAPFRS